MSGRIEDTLSTQQENVLDLIYFTQGAVKISSTMSSGCMRFIQIPELVAMVVQPHLSKKDIACLMRTCHQLRIQTTPFLFHTLYANNCKRIMSSTDCLKAFARNSHHVKELSSYPSFMSLLYNCLLAYQAFNPPTRDQALPSWLPRPDNTLSEHSAIIPIPPMTSLLSCTIYSSEWNCNEEHPMFMPSCKIPTVRQAQVYGVLHYSSQLKQLLLFFTIDAQVDIQLLAAAISRMSNLQALDIQNLECPWEDNKLLPIIVACCPPSLIALEISYRTWEESYNEGWQWKTEAEMEAEDEAVKHFMPLVEGENVVVIVPRQGHLDKLFRLCAGQLDMLTADEICSVFQQCPNLISVSNLELSEHIDPIYVAKFIGEHCSKVSRLVHIDRNRPRSFRLIMDILNTLPTHTVQGLIYRPPDKTSVELASRLLRHSASLREICLENHQEFNSKAFQSILVHCHALETFKCVSSGPVWAIKFELADAIEFPWASTRLKHLRLLIAMNYAEPSPEGPFYKRQSLTYLTAAEYSQIIMLEKLYSQIGRLVDMENLSISLFNLLRPGCNSYHEISFPGMLSLAREASDRLGYLHLLAGLKKLRVLESINMARSGETIKLVEQSEVEWIAQNWPSLEEVTFFHDPRSGQPKHQPKPPCFLWLQDKMPRLKMDVAWNR